LPGVAYSPYHANHACKTQEEVAQDFRRLKGKYSMVRIYGTDCSQVETVRNAAKEVDIKLFLGIWDPNKLEQETQAIIEGVHGDWAMVEAVAVGNEVIDRGEATPEQLNAAVRETRATLRAAGYQGPVVSVNTQIAVERYPELCSASDLCAINAHPFFDRTSSAENAGQWLNTTVARLQAVLPEGTKFLISETGWPTRGLTNGLAVPNTQSQRAALASIKEAFAENQDDVVFLSAFDSLLKEDHEGTFLSEKYWGIHEDEASMPKLGDVKQQP
ncbi:glycoside hydrolase superfamily, partial [Stachybotrys elegans]